LEVTYGLVYHPLVVQDIAEVNRDIRTRLGKAIQDRLAIHPESHGKPLRGSLAGYWSLRVGDCRVVYKIKGQEVWVFGIIDRRDVYEDVLKRLAWRP
jgi:mRNA interferase RelE/StbE